MTQTTVVDASAVAALIFGEVEGESVLKLLRDRTLIAPELIGYELASVCAKKARKQPQLASTFARQLRLRHALAIEEMRVDHDAIALLATSTRLSAYDASYLWLAEQTKSSLVTLDGRLAAVTAERRG